MRHFIFSLTFLLGFQFTVVSQVSDTSGVKYEFTTVVDLEHTNVKNQGSSGTCWSYSTNSFFESEMQRMGRPSIDLSEMFVVRNTYLSKADRYVRMHGVLNFGQGGALPDVVQMFKKYGAVPQSVYSGLEYDTEINRHGELDAVLKAMLDAVISNKNKKLTPKWKEAFTSVLDVYLGKAVSTFGYEGKQYTPMSFAKEVVGINPDDYVQLTSWTHQDFYEPMVIMVPDNWDYGISYNVPINDMTNIVDHALNNGYTVTWATDVSEKYFSWKNGVAVLPANLDEKITKDDIKMILSSPHNEMLVTQEMRQKAYDNYTTSDDHGMHIVGLTKDQNGKEYYIVKNSWDTKNPHDGYIYVSKAYFKYKTISFLMNKNAIPKTIKNKLGL